MKQHITTEQWNEVAIEQQKKFWDTDEPADFLLPSIGQMIKFLDESSDHFNTAYTQGDDPQIKRNRTIVWEYDEDLCDVLWKDVKRELDQGFGA